MACYNLDQHCRPGTKLASIYYGGVMGNNYETPVSHGTLWIIRNGLLETKSTFNMIERINPGQSSVEPDLAIITFGGHNVAKGAQVVVVGAGRDRRHTFLSHGSDHSREKKTITKTQDSSKKQR